eukprot:gnl/MRDRNA2_/MRDRNA2_79276_c0_seq1.p1 gnl/MRDRNA2_/MRDRNA2_79276_c0~~gnl/MRDRNA2_/MRDRNA2_79276_c0_seq1.p1  ORF type:complete len:196 (+),score=25.17 gnl/MRDRNA2_/MRDRNA2_79276_c0_seq1:90-677(+)
MHFIFQRLQQAALRYDKAFLTWPLSTNVATGITLGFVGDIFCQKAVEKQDHINWRRNAALTFFGGFYDGGICYYIYGSYASRILSRWWLQTPARSAVGCTLLDNFVHVPLLYTPSFFMITQMLQGRCFGDALETLQEGLWPATQACWIMWIPLQTINFWFVPSHLRVLVVNTGNMVWNVVLNHLAQQTASKRFSA